MRKECNASLTTFVVKHFSYKGPVTVYGTIKEACAYYILLSDLFADAVSTLEFFEMFRFRGSYVHIFAMEPLVTYVTAYPRGVGMALQVSQKYVTS